MVEQNYKYLTFKLSKEDYAIPILKIKEIIGMMEITKVPRLPNFFKGIINLRGKIIPIIDLRLKFGLEGREYDERTSIIVVELKTESGHKISGIVVDAVQEVMEIPNDQIEKPPKYNNIEQEFLKGIGKIQENVIMMLDVDKILSTDENQELETIN